MLSSRKMDICEGSIFNKMLRYTIPIILTGILQLLYNAADLVVIGQFGKDGAFAAVGASGALYNLFVTFFIAIAGGGCICVAQYYGARDHKNVSETVHTSVVFSVLMGIVIGIIGIVFVEDALRLMGTHEDIIEMSALYLRVIFASTPFMLLYNFAAGILRATGDTKRPLYILAFTGLLNVVLNLIFVICFDMSVLGVALATSIGSVVNAVLGAYILLKTNDSTRVFVKNLKIHADKLKKILAYGIPSGIQSMLFSFSNVIIQSAVNSFDLVAVVGGSAAAANIEGFIYTSMNSVSQSALNFSGQNFGARKYKRVDRSLLASCAITSAVGMTLSLIAYLLAPYLIRIYEPTDIDALKYGLIRISVIVPPYFICGIQEAIVSTLRGIGSSWAPTLVSTFSIVGVRILWILTVFRKYHTLQMLFISWPLTWISSAILLVIIYQTTKKKYFKLNEERNEKLLTPEK